MGSDTTRAVRGALAGAAAAAVWAAQQPLDRRIFGVSYDDTELLGALLTRRRGTPASTAVGTALHLTNGALFGAVYATVAPSLGGRRPSAAVGRGIAMGVAEHLASWPLTRLLPLHPATRDFPPLWGSRAAFAQATWRHVVFGAVLGAAERRLNPPVGEAAPAEPDRAGSNGHGNVEHLVTARAV